MCKNKKKTTKTIQAYKLSTLVQKPQIFAISGYPAFNNCTTEV